MKKNLSIRILILRVPAISAGVRLSAKCTIDFTTMHMKPSCESMSSANKTKLKQALSGLADNLERLINNTGDNCIPEGLKNILKDRLCGPNAPLIYTDCKNMKKRKRPEQRRVWCDKKDKYVWEDVIEDPQAAVSGPRDLTVDTKNLAAKTVDEYEQDLFHEMIHLAENLYGENNMGNAHVSSEEFSYTCTKQFYESANCTNGKTYPAPEPCPDDKPCRECGDYVSPNDPSRQRGSN